MAVINQSCPGSDALQRFLVGKVSEPDLVAIEDHLSHCEACAEYVEHRPASDTLLDLLQAAEPTAPDGGLVEQLVVQLRSLPQTAPGAPSSDAGAAKTAGDDQTPEWLELLDPPEGPNELGRLASYRILKVLGAGGMGVVFQAEDVQLRRLVALKIMKPALAVSHAARQRFLREAQAVAAIEHEHIVTIYQVGDEGHRAFLAMQWLQGETLEERLRRDPPPSVAEILQIGEQTALGLAAAHEKRLIHRDIKPGNIWLEGARQRVKLLDFGLARAVDDDLQLTAISTIAGTPAYMAPEQAHGGDLDERTDLFALGCVLYRMCTGRVPFHGSNALATLRAVEEASPQPPREIRPDIPEGLSRLVMALLEKIPECRPRSAVAVAEALAAIGQPGEAELLAILVEPQTRCAAVAAPLATAAVARPEPARSARRPRPGLRQALAAACVALLLLVLGGTGWYFFPRSAVWRDGAAGPSLGERGAARGPLSSTPAGQHLKAEYYHDFRDQAFDLAHLLPVGFDSVYGFTLLNPENAGLRITIPLRQGKQRPHLGFSPTCELAGDFEIMASYEILGAKAAPAGCGIGPTLYVMLKGEDRGYVLRRAVLSQGQPVLPGVTKAFSLQYVERDATGRMNARWKYFPADADSGVLCLARTGKILKYFVAESGGEFRQLAETEIGDEPIRWIRVDASVEREEGSLDMRWTDITIRAQELRWTELRLLNPRRPPSG